MTYHNIHICVATVIYNSSSFATVQHVCLNPLWSATACQNTLVHRLTSLNVWQAAALFIQVWSRFYCNCYRLRLQRLWRKMILHIPVVFHMRHKKYKWLKLVTRVGCVILCQWWTTMTHPWPVFWNKSPMLVQYIAPSVGQLYCRSGKTGLTGAMAGFTPLTPVLLLPLFLFFLFSLPRASLF